MALSESELQELYDGSIAQSTVLREYESLQKACATVREFKKSDYGKGGKFSMTLFSPTSSGVSLAVTGVSVSANILSYATKILWATIPAFQCIGVANKSELTIKATGANACRVAIMPILDIMSLHKKEALGSDLDVERVDNELVFDDEN